MTAADLIDRARRIRRDTIGALGLVAFVAAPVWLVMLLLKRRGQR